MTGITVTPIPGGPPAVTVAIDGGATMTTVVLRRTADGASELTRVQPATGAASAAVQDYELPWDTDVTYTATVTTAGGTTSYTSAAVNLSASDAWAIHPVYPQRSIIIDRQHPTSGIWVTAVDSVTRPASYTEHQVIGSPFPVTVTATPRISVRGTMTVHTSDLGDKTSLLTLVQGQTPVLIRFPASWGVDWEDGFYQLGDLGETRLGVAAAGDRLFTIPFLRVQPPAVTVQTGWDYPTIAATFADYPTLTATFADYGALTENRRS